MSENLHMDVEAVRSVQSRIMGLQSQIEGLMQPLNATIANLPLHWQANSANEFYGEYEELRSSIASVLETLEELASELSAEIAAWERMAEKLS